MNHFEFNFFEKKTILFPGEGPRDQERERVLWGTTADDYYYDDHCFPLGSEFEIWKFNYKPRFSSSILRVPLLHDLPLWRLQSVREASRRGKERGEKKKLSKVNKRHVFIGFFAIAWLCPLKWFCVRFLFLFLKILTQEFEVGGVGGSLIVVVVRESKERIIRNWFSKEEGFLM